MLTITTPPMEFFDNEQGIFVNVKSYNLNMEHSLVSLSKWEAKWKKPFLHTDDKTPEELRDYIRCMTITQNVPDDVYRVIENSPAIMQRIVSYIQDPMTATKITDHGSGRGERKIITSEVIYSWMVQHNIPVEFQKWHLNRLITLVRVCNAQNAPAKKMSQREIMKQNAKLNRQRRAKYRSSG